MRVRFAACATLVVVAIGVGAALASAEPARRARGCGGEKVPGVAGIVGATAASLGRLPSTDTAVVLGIGAAAAISAGPVDDFALRQLTGSNSWHEFLEPGGATGSAAAQFGGSIATYAVGRVAGKPCLAAVGAELISAQLVAELLTAGVKLAVQRERPDGTQYSFPSGHASVTFAGATVLTRRFGWKAAVPAYTVASYVALSRVQANRHYLSDVVFGASIGVVSGLVAVPRTRTVTVVPSITPGGVSLSVMWLK